MHNNRGYHQEVMHVQRLSNFRNRVANLGNDMGPIGTSIENPDIEYHKLAESMGWWAKGPIKDPAELGPAIKEAVPGQGRPAGAGQRLDPAALSITSIVARSGRSALALRGVCRSGDLPCVCSWLAALAAGLVFGQGRRARGVRREGQGGVRQARLLAVSRLPGAGRHHRAASSRPIRCRWRPSPTFIRSYQPHHAAVHGGDPVE